jgi:tetratricopeptide (TPR) repeat protein
MTRRPSSLSPIANTALGERLRYARQYDQAIEALKKALERDKNFPNVHFSLGHVYVAKGQHAETVAS